MSNFSRVLRYQSSDASLADDWVVITMPGPARDAPRDGGDSSSEESESETAPAAPKAAAKVAAKASAKAAAVPHPPGAPPPPPPPHNPDNVLSDSDSMDSLEITHGSGRHGRRGTEPAREAAPNPAPKRTAAAPPGDVRGGAEEGPHGKGRSDRVREPAEVTGSKHDGRGREEVWDRERGREPCRAHHKRRERRGSSKGKGKESGKGKSRRCPHCYQRVSSWPSSFDQHQYWSEQCLAWQAYNRGNGHLTWQDAQSIAAGTKERRQRQHEEELAKEARDTPGDAMAASKEAYDATVAHMKKMDHFQEGGKDKTAKKKRRERREKKASPSPSPPRRGGPHKKPPGSDSEDERPSGSKKRRAVTEMLKALVTCL